MSTNADDIVIDLDELDKNLADNGKKPPPKAPPEVTAAEPEPKPDDKPVLKPDEGIEKLQ